MQNCNNGYICITLTLRLYLHLHLEQKIFTIAVNGVGIERTVTGDGINIDYIFLLAFEFNLWKLDGKYFVCHFLDTNDDFNRQIPIKLLDLMRNYDKLFKKY